MKNIWNGIVGIALCLFISTGLQAQEKDKDKDKYKPGTEKDRDNRDDRDKSRDNSADRETNERLTRDVYTRNPAAKDAVIIWDNTDDGYDGTYAVGDVKYMSRYDRSGNYVETLVEKKWDDSVPRNVRSSYENSRYKSNKVDRFWEVNEPNRRGYYLEFKDNDGKSRRIWSDRDGKFTEPDDRNRDY